jgi:putative peptide zinc metalloprotease protein
VQVWPVHAPGGARLTALNYREGDVVEAGAVIATLHVADLQTRRQALSSRVEQLREQAATAGFSDQTRPRMRVAEESLATARAELSSVNTELRDYAPQAPWRGTLRDVDPDLHAGQWLARKERLAVLVREGTPWQVETWLDESAVARVAVGQKARFYAQAGDGPPLELVVQAVDRDATRVLPRRELAAQAGGDVLVREKAGQPIPERAVYRVTLAPAAGAEVSRWARHHWRGTVTVHAVSEAPAWRYLRQAGAVMVRELGF